LRAPSSPRPRPSLSAAVLAFAAVAGAALPAQAAPPRSYELEHVDARFLAFELATSVAFTGVTLLAAGPAPTSCSWCGSNGFDESIRKLLLADNPRAPAGLSHAFSSAAAPALALGALVPPAFMSSGGREALENVVVAFDSVIVTVGITHVTKHAVARERPAVHHHVVSATEYADDTAQWYQSFFSGDTSLAFSVVSSATTISFLRGYSVAPYVLGMGAVLGLGTAGLRIAADMHWATDVLTGAAVGTAIGFGMPYFLHARKGASGERTLVVVPRVGSGELGIVAGGTF